MIKIDNSFISGIVKEAKRSARRRKNHNFHKVPEDTLQRMVHAMEPDTYVQPHKHENPDKREAFIILKGSVAVIEFDEKGVVMDYIIMNHESGNYGVDIQPGTWHTLICLETGSVVYEVKDGPYNPSDDKQFASWAPCEGDPDALKYNEQIIKYLKLK
ncbi:MAG: WbuC family cupin fold metalloprotein [Bacteroidales bacterium]|nr:WbuC family cupin fold metalloprotein [Bacteroidales bacterium]